MLVIRRVEIIVKLNSAKIDEETEVGGKVDINEADKEKDIVRVNNNVVDLNVEDVGRHTVNDAAAATYSSNHGRNTTAEDSNLDPESLFPATWTPVADVKSFYLGSNLTLVIFVNHNRPTVQRHPFVGYFGKVNNFKNCEVQARIGKGW